MNLDGFHYLPQAGRLGYKVPASKLDYAKPLIPGKSTANWRYEVDVPHTGTTDSRLWFTYADLAHLMMQSEDDVRAMARKYRWRSRRNNTSKIRQLYLYDVLVSVWTYMIGWEGNTLSQPLLREADNRAEELGVLRDV
jgi:hypothetical protein